jgi:hypothetical protein
LSVVLITLMISDSAVAQTASRRLFADTGVITLGPNQVLRLTVAAGDVNGDDDIRVRFRRTGYIEQDNLYKVASQSTSAQITLAPGEAASIDITQGAFKAVRGVVMGNLIGTDAARARVTAQIINTSTGEVTSNIIMANTEGDFH